MISKTFQFVALLACAGVPIIPLASPADAQTNGGISEADRTVLKGYVLTVPTMERIAVASSALKKAEKTDAALRKEDSEAANEGSSVGQLVAAVERHPRIAGYYHRAGLADRDAVIFPLVIMGAAIADADPRDAGIQAITPEQLKFYQAHKARLQAILFSDDPANP